MAQRRVKMKRKFTIFSHWVINMKLFLIVVFNYFLFAEQIFLRSNINRYIYFNSFHFNKSIGREVRRIIPEICFICEQSLSYYYFQWESSHSEYWQNTGFYRSSVFMITIIPIQNGFRPASKLLGFIADIDMRRYGYIFLPDFFINM